MKRGEGKSGVSWQHHPCLTNGQRPHRITACPCFASHPFRSLGLGMRINVDITNPRGKIPEDGIRFRKLFRKEQEAENFQHEA